MNKINNTNSLLTGCFSSSYRELTEYMVNNGTLQKSRAGDTMELLNFKTTITNPRERCVGGASRNINIFFLLQEAIWIWLGKKDLHSLQIFNSNMKNFSDDGQVFHAPYGFRLRNYGVASNPDLFLRQCEEQGRETFYLRNNGIDQIKLALQMLSSNKEDRRVVAAIWNPDLDLNFKCKDIPCNDMLMFKIRDRKLHMTVQNRSNDLHWGLPTNVFQFSFILELMAEILNVEVGTQTHNSQSLHVYLNNPITLTMMGNKSGNELYNLGFKADPMDIELGMLTIEDRLEEVDDFLEEIFDGVIRKYEHNIEPSQEDFDSIQMKSAFFHSVYKLLLIYVDYTKATKDDESRIKAITSILEIETLKPESDLMALAINFFVNRLDDKDSIVLLEDKKLLGISLLDLKL